MNHQTVIDAVISRLSDDQTAGSLHAYVGGRIYYAAQPDHPDFPSCVVYVISEKRERFFTPQIANRFTIRIDLFSSTTAGVTAAGDGLDRLVEQLDNQRITVSRNVVGRISLIHRLPIQVDRQVVLAASAWEMLVS